MIGLEKKESAFTRAYNYVRSLIIENKKVDSLLLPSISEMAKQSSVSPLTMWKTIQSLCKSGFLIAKKGRGVYIAPSHENTFKHFEDFMPKRSAALPGTSDSIYKRLIADITNGKYRAGQLIPSYKELHNRYGSSYQTMKTVLETAAENGVIVPFGKGYSVYQSKPLLSAAKIVFIAASDSMDILANCTPRSQEFWRSLGSELLRLNITLEVFSFERAIATFLDGKSERKNLKRSTPMVLGFIVFAVGLHNDDFDLLSRITKTSGKPLALLDESGLVSYKSNFTSNNLCRRYPLYGTKSAGMSVGEFLIEKGHHSIAYFSDSKQNEKPLDREIGLFHSYTNAGLNDGIRSFSPYHDNKDILQISAISNALEGDLTNRILKQIELGGKKWLPMDLESFKNNHLFPFFSQSLSIDMMNPVFEKALTYSSMSAWVLRNDQLGFVALDWLKKKNIRVPEDLTVIAFDDTVDSFGRGLTSYNFNTSVVVRSMLDHILNYQRKWTQLDFEIPPIEIPGFIIQRRSVRTISQ